MVLASPESGLSVEPEEKDMELYAQEDLESSTSSNAPSPAMEVEVVERGL